MQSPKLVGLCAACRHTKIVQSAKGSVFVMCGWAKEDPRFNKYPVLPVLRCTGFVPDPEVVSSQPPDSSPAASGDQKEPQD